MNNQTRACVALAAGAAALLAISGVFAQSNDPNSAPNPYKMEDNWAKLPDGRKMGAPIGVEVDRDGKSLWVFDRCGANDCGKDEDHHRPDGKPPAALDADIPPRRSLDGHAGGAEEEGVVARGMPSRWRGRYREPIALDRALPGKDLRRRQRGA